MEAITFIKPLSVSEPYYSSCIELYKSAFPADERREIESLEKLLSDRRFNFYYLMDGNILSGFITIWQFTDFVYVEHFAVFPRLRSSGIGSRVIAKLVHTCKTIIVLEIERPITEQARRRLDFYLKNGFQVIKNNYIQPAYGHDKKPVPSLLLGNESLNPDQLECIVKKLYLAVYEIS